MKKYIIFLALVSNFGTARAQLFSSGNNTISGTRVGIGINTPATLLHVMGNSTSTEVLRIQNNATNSTTRFTLFNDGGTNTRATFTKYSSIYAGGYTSLTSQFPLANLFAFGNVKGALMLNAAGSIGISYYNGTANKLRFFVDTTARTSIGGSAWPKSHVHINNTDGSADTIRITNNATGHNTADGLVYGNTGNNAFITNLEAGSLIFGTNGLERLAINSAGSITIGSVSNPPGYKLYVEQGILTEKLKVAVKSTSEWSDFVFSPTYKLLPLKEVGKYIDQNKHLPQMPSADQVVAQGIDVAKMDALLLQKIEELTLYLIELQKQNDELQSQLQLIQAERR
ncbi:MAG: hypothetical protein RL660_2405 [Bacteroidota bacterium]|jgi:hypothetical protein